MSLLRDYLRWFNSAPTWLAYAVREQQLKHPENLNAVPVLADPSCAPESCEGGEAREAHLDKTEAGSRGGVQPISPDSGLGACTENPAKAEGDSNPALSRLARLFGKSLGAK
jgi:hypothetical protein